MQDKKPIIELNSYEDLLSALAGGNLASLNTAPSRAHSKTVELADYGAHVFNLIESVHVVVEDESAVELLLTQIINVVTLEVPLHFRPQLFERLNQLMAVLMARYFGSQKMYDLSFKLMSAFKKHIDAEPQLEESLEEKEFNELEKAVYMLTDWEDQIQYQANASAVTAPLQRL